jgi:hypothetical protein
MGALRLKLRPGSSDVITERAVRHQENEHRDQQGHAVAVSIQSTEENDPKAACG